VLVTTTGVDVGYAIKFSPSQVGLLVNYYIYACLARYVEAVAYILLL
jgi:hypothetical protein